MSWSSKLQGEKFSSSLSKKKLKPDKIEVKWTSMNGNGEVYPMIYVNGKLDKKQTSDVRWAMTKIGWKNFKKLAPDVFAELVGINDIKTLLDPKSSLAQNGMSFFSLLLTYFPMTKAVKIAKAMEAAKVLKAGGESIVDLNKISKAAGLTEKEAKGFEELWKSENITRKAEDLSNIDSLDANKISHILQKHHNWGKVVDNPKDWGQVRDLISKVIESDGVETVIRPTSPKIFEKVAVINDEKVAIQYRMVDGKKFITNSWVVY